jgi:hypothetical protein
VEKRGIRNRPTRQAVKTLNCVVTKVAPVPGTFPLIAERLAGPAGSANASDALVPLWMEGAPFRDRARGHYLLLSSSIDYDNSWFPLPQFAVPPSAIETCAIASGARPALKHCNQAHGYAKRSGNVSLPLWQHCSQHLVPPGILHIAWVTNAMSVHICPRNSSITESYVAAFRPIRHAHPAIEPFQPGSQSTPLCRPTVP